MIKAVEHVFSGGQVEADAVGVGMTGAITTRTATLIDTVSRVAARRILLTRSARGIAPHN